MFKHTARRAVSAARIAAAVMSLAGCDASIEGLAEEALSGLLHAPYAAQREPVPGFGLMAAPTAIEYRHFALYRQYQALFDEPPSRHASGAAGGAGAAGIADACTGAAHGDRHPARTVTCAAEAARSVD